MKRKEFFFGMILFYAGAFSVSYLVMPGSMYQSGIILSTISLIYSSIINYYSTKIIIKECSENKIVDYYDYYNHVLGKKMGKIIFFVFFINAFLITVCTLCSLNELMSDFLETFTTNQLLTNPIYCFWAIVLTVITTPFIYKSSDESMSLITFLTSFAIGMSIVAVLVTFFKKGGFNIDGSLNYVRPKGSVFSFDVSYFSFIVQLNIFDLFEMYEGSLEAKFNKIKKVSYYTNYLIFFPAFIMGNNLFFFKFLILRNIWIFNISRKSTNQKSFFYKIS